MSISSVSFKTTPILDRKHPKSHPQDPFGAKILTGQWFVIFDIAPRNKLQWNSDNSETSYLKMTGVPADMFVKMLSHIRGHTASETELMKTSSNENDFRITGSLWGEFTGEFPSQRPSTRIFDIFLICIWINGWVNNRKAGDLGRHLAHYDVIVMCWSYV